MSDVKRGHCWYCRKPGDKVPCPRCKIGVYCSQNCLGRDRRRHGSECQSFGPQKCSYCHKQLQNRLECTGCGEDFYCGSSCQRKHWKSHKTLCQVYKVVLQRGAMEWKGILDLYKNAKHSGEMPYYFGSDFAVDYLMLKDNEWQMPYKADDTSLMVDYSMMVLGCGDIRSLLFTIASLPEQYKGKLSIMMCDFDPFVMARNVLFLYMLVKYGEKPNISKMIATLWYSVYISKEDHDFLQEVLCSLCSISEDESVSQLTNGLVTMPNDQRDVLIKVWKRWSSLECDTKKRGNIAMHRDRRKLRSYLIPKYHIRDDISEEQIASYKKWDFDGIFTESALEVEHLPYFNPTLTGFKGCEPFAMHTTHTDPSPTSSELKKPLEVDSVKFSYCIMCKSEPFMAWDYENVKDLCNDTSLAVMFHAYVSDIISKAICFIHKEKRVSVTMTMEEFHDLKQEAIYDRVFTSTLADHYGVQPLVEFCGPFLRRTNKHAVIIMGTFAMMDDAALYLYDQFELDCRDAKIMEMACGELFELDETWPLPWDCHVLDYHYDWHWFMRFLKAVYMAVNETDIFNAKVPSCKTVMRCGDLQMRDIRLELNKVVPYRYTWAVREGVFPVKGLRYMEWFYPS